MKINFKVISILIIAVIIISCKKNKQEKPVEEPGKKPVPVEHGTLVEGTAVQKTIGAAGGTIEVPNSTISVNIPAGAVDNETPFSIQEVTSTLGVNGLGKSYRLLPENVQFKQDVEITFKYTAEMLAGKFEDLLFMAYQDSKGYWRVPKNTELDKTNKTLKVKTRHFSDWSGFCSAYLYADKKKLASNEQATLKGEYYFNVSDPEHPDNDDLLNPSNDADNEHIEEWKVVAGLGNVTPKTDGTATFKAPANITELSTSKVQLKFKNIINPRTKTEGLVLAYTDIQLLPEQYVEWEFDGVKRFSHVPAAQYADGSGVSGIKHLIITASAIPTLQPIGINIVGTTKGTYSFSTYDMAGKANVSTIDNGSFGVYSPACKLMMIGYVDVTDVNEYVEGTFSGTLIYYSDFGCSDMRRPISGSFRVKAPK